MTALVIVAAGRGTRAASGTDVPKQYQLLDGVPLLRRTIDNFVDIVELDHLLVVIARGDRSRYDDIVGELSSRLLPPVEGGDTRQASVLAGLEALVAHGPQRVLIHDAARPFARRALTERVLNTLDAAPAALPALAVADTLKRDDGHGAVRETVARTGLWRAQTPQGFRFDDILEAHRAAAMAETTEFTDDASLMEWRGHQVVLVAGDEANCKITTADDLERAERSLRRETMLHLSDIRVGQGFDVHRLGPGDHIILCGVRLAHDRALIGHSDADVGLHALTDAILGALGEGDIGMHFPPSEPKWRGAASEIFARAAAERVQVRKGIIAHVDITLVCERPKIAPHRDQMRARIASILALDLACVSVKATTSEGLGFTGREEGIAAMANVTVRLPAP